MREFNVCYDAPDGERLYQMDWTDHVTCQHSLEKWQRLYGIDGGNPYPNGKGYYPFSKPRIVYRER